MTIKEFITHEAGNDEAWICICGNRPDSDGFDTCDADGNEMEPLIGSNWDGLYVCRRCGRIIQQKSLEVVGRKGKKQKGEMPVVGEKALDRMSENLTPEQDE